LQITRTAEEKLWSHGIERDQVAAVPEGRTVLARNRKGRAASHILIGRDAQGRCLAIPVRPTDDPTVWRVITAWPCKRSEAAKLR
jgi:hypothetical protein